MSIIIPVYNRANVVDRTLSSVLAQTHRPLELILVDNDSTDNTLQVLQDFKRDHEAPDFEVMVVQESYHTAGAARNRGLQYATSDWVMFFDSDDEMLPRLVERYVKTIARKHDEVDLIAARGVRMMADGSKYDMPFFKHDVMANHILHGMLSTSRFALRRSLALDSDAWNINLPRWNDWEFGVRLLLMHPRLGFARGKAQMVWHESGEASITGTDFASRSSELGHVLNVVADEFRCCADEHRSRYLRLVDYRRVVLAAHYEREGRRDLARPLCRRGIAGFAGMPFRRWLVIKLFGRIVEGKRGSARIARLLL